MVQKIWQDALNGHECGSSNYICIEHFTVHDYTISKDGKRFELESDAIPSVCSISLIEYEEDEEEEGAESGIVVDEFQSDETSIRKIHKSM